MKKLILFFITTSLFAQDFGTPLVTNKDAYIEKSFYELQYNEKFEQADWVAYELTKAEVMGQTKRRDSFKEDPEVTTGSASLADYKGSGYSRGHMAPAADMKMSSLSMSESFYMSNMSPQIQSFNGGIWAQLESMVRTWAYEYDNIFVVTGPVLTEDWYPTIGENEVAVPEFYYKVILDFNNPKAIGFILPHEKGTRSIESYAMSIDDVEEFTGVDFFPALAVFDMEEEIESEFDVSLWNFDGFNSGDHEPETEPEEVVSEQYWINSSSRSRHNSTCRNYGKTKRGYYTTEPEGKACGICGG